ncbi:hypothetical protein PHMEG_00020373 [Phytophthora megakarya]|uniref:Uncharacterized protein n=1 Tax=Phytophthora megakarya TaxID=4795 RepID=A0A225VR26_9STRA|nr:hypothetical protein PHMEG_00020373 [Phytophthora megakarya]
MLKKISVGFLSFWQLATKPDSITTHEPDIHIRTDASNQGLCALFPAQQQYLQLESSATERANHDSDTHVKFWIDNTYDVAWSNKKSSKNKFAQILLRILAIHEIRQHNGECRKQGVAVACFKGAIFSFVCWMDAGSDSDRLAESLSDLGARLRARALAQTSRKGYTRAWSQWVVWCEMMHMSPWLAATGNDRNAEQLGAFAVYLWKYGMDRKQVRNTCNGVTQNSNRNVNRLEFKVSCLDVWTHQDYI